MTGLSISMFHRISFLLASFILYFTNVTMAGCFAAATVDGDSLVVVKNINFAGNRITRDHIISRELMFSEGDTLEGDMLLDLIERSRENMMNTLLFNFVDADLRLSGSSPAHAEITFEVTERWYIWPWPVIEFADRNFNTWWDDGHDLSRMSYGIALKWGNFRGRKENLEITAIYGYNEIYGFDYTIPYLNRKETLGIAMGADYGRTREVPVRNEGDKLIYFKRNDEHVMEAVSAYMGLICRKAIYNTHVVRIEYDLQEFSDTLLEINPGFSVGNQDRLQYFSLVYQYKSDHRDYRAYPLTGYYFDVEFGRRGLGIVDKGDMDVTYVLTTFRKYFHLGGRWYYASGLNSRFSNDAEQPFLMNKAIGYGRDIVRGYEYYVVNGNHFGIFKNNLKFALLPTRNFDIRWLKSEKFSKVHYAFYLNAFFDLGYADNLRPVEASGNELENTLLTGYGLGLDFVTYYDLVLRIEYSFNHMKEHGFFLHFMAPI